MKEGGGPLKVVAEVGDAPLPDKSGQFGSETLAQIKAPLSVSAPWLWLWPH